MLTIAYVRVSTEDQIEHSPEAQPKRCLQHAITMNLGPVTFLSDEGVSGKSLDRPAMTELISLVESNEVEAIVVWRLDRLARDSGDLSRLIRLFERHCVTVHSVNEGVVQVDTAAGRMQAGMHGVFAQYYREHVIENVRLGITEAISKGRWLNRPPTGYDLINGELTPNELAGLVVRVINRANMGMMAKIAFDALRFALPLDDRAPRRRSCRRVHEPAGDRAAGPQRRARAGQVLRNAFRKVPFRFNITIRGPFRSLIQTAKSYRDPRQQIDTVLPRPLEDIPGIVTEVRRREEEKQQTQTPVEDTITPTPPSER